MPHLLMLVLLICLTLTPGAGYADTGAPGVVFHLDSEMRMNRMLAQVARHHAFNPDIETHVILIAEGVKPAIEGAEDANGGQYSAQMEQLMNPYFCLQSNTNSSPSQRTISLLAWRPSLGVATLGRPAREGWASL